MNYRKFFNVWETIERVGECASLETPGMNRETRAAWVKDYEVGSRLFSSDRRTYGGFFLLLQTLIDTARQQICKLLKAEWLVSDVEIPGGKPPRVFNIVQKIDSSPPPRLGDRRRRDLIRIRQIYIPELVIRLHAMLFTSRDKIPKFVPFPFFRIVHID